MTALINRLKADPRVTVAALIGCEFHVDPVMVLKSDYFDFALRTAALELVQEGREAANEQQRQKMK